MEENSINIVRGYSRAVFKIAHEFSLQEQFMSLLGCLSAVVQDIRIVKLIKNGIIDWEDKANLLLSLVNINTTADTSNCSLLIANLIKSLAKNKHLLLIPKIFVWYDKLLLQVTDALRVEVISAIELNAAQKTKLHQDLTNNLGKILLLEYKIDPTIIAGIVIKYDDQVVDYSFRKKILNLQQELLE